MTDLLLELSYKLPIVAARESTRRFKRAKVRFMQECKHSAERSDEAVYTNEVRAGWDDERVWREKRRSALVADVVRKRVRCIGGSSVPTQHSCAPGGGQSNYDRSSKPS